MPTRKRNIETPMGDAWLDYTDSVLLLLVPQQDDRALDQYMEFRDNVYKIVQGDLFLHELNQAWSRFYEPPNAEIGAALLIELKSFSRSIESARATEDPSDESKGWIKKWLGRASTVTGSVKDIVENLPPYAKNGITLFKELVDIFKG